jgi:tetratricopeptide (TPR) repeat protein
VAKRKSKGDSSRASDIERTPDAETASETEPESGTELPPDAFADALRSALNDPSDESPWDRLEDQADSDRARKQLLDLYSAQLGNELPGPVKELLARRAVRFAADCFGENTPPVTDLLRLVLGAVPGAEWAFEHLVVALTMNERWPEVLEAHDARLALTKDPGRRKELLEEAAQIAKDFLGDQGRAIGYLEQLFRLKPSDVQVAASLERLLERQERWEDLVQLWRQRAEALSGGQARALQRQAAVTLYEKLRRPEAALQQVRALLPDEGEETPLHGLLERVLADESAPPASRLGALALLRQRHDASGKRERVPELLQIAIRFAEGEELRNLRRECGERLFVLGDAGGAIDQYVALACLLPEDREVEDRLRQLAEAAGDPGRLARGLAAAASACGSAERRIELLTRAALVHDRQLGNRAEAAALSEEAIAHRAAPAELRLTALRRLEELYAELGEDGKRLHTLERLAAVEPKRGEQRLVWARVAELAARLGEVDRALAAWEARLSTDPGDVEALAAQARLLEGAARWQQLTDLLRRRVATAPPAHQVRADLVQIATVAEEQLGDRVRATETWREITSRFGEDAESVSALADLYAAQERFSELADLLSRNALLDGQRHAAMLCRLGDVLRERMDDRSAAVGFYRRALDVDPSHPEARAGLSALLADPGLASAAAEVLAAAAERTDSWELLLEVLPHRLAGIAEAPRRVRLLVEAAARAEARASDPKRAFTCIAQALPQAGADVHLRGELLRLAEVTGEHEAAARALGEAMDAGAAPATLLAELAEARGQLQEQRLQDLDGARQSYARGLAWRPERLELRLGLLRTAARLSRWAEAADALVDGAVAPSVREATLLPLYESIAAETDRFTAAAAALTLVTDQAADLPAPVRRDLHARVARHYLDRCADLRAASEALDRAKALDPEHLALLALQADLQRRSPDRRLWDTLSGLAVREPANLDHLREAAELALVTLKDEGLARDALGRLWIEAVRLMRLQAPARGRHQPADVAAYALEQLVGLQAGSGAADRVRQACDLLLEGARLGFPTEKRWAWLARAAELTERSLGDRGAAIDAWQMLYTEAAADAAEHQQAREALARLHEEVERHGQAVALRVAELEQTSAPERRLALRLEITRLAALAERKTSPAEVMRANLAEQPGHPDSVRRLTEVLEATGRSAQLADILEDQAEILETRGEPGRSAELWAQAARLEERALQDRARAMKAWERVTRLSPTSEALDALGALQSASGDFVAAATWLDRRLGLTEGEARAEVAVRLARAYLSAGQRHRAIACLERTLTDLPAAEALRNMLADLYRSAEAHEQLARVLAEGCDYLSDPTLAVARAREAAELFAQLGLLARAVPVLEKAVRLQPADESLRSALADGLQQLGRHEEARALLLQMIEEAGWRRSRKRALLHERLARVARQTGDLVFALEHLEQAASMEVANADLLVQLAEVAEAKGEVERAERSYRALLVGKRKEGGAPGGLAATEVLLRLHDLASKRGNAAQAAELLDSALEAAMGDAGEAERLQRALLDRGAHDALTRLFEKRRQHAAGSPAEAEVYGQMAESLRRQGRLEEAFEAQVLAIQSAPERAHLHEAAVELARGQDRVALLVERLLALAGKRRRRPDAEVAGALLLRAAQLCDTDLRDRDRALELYRRAEETGCQSVDLWSALGKLALERGDGAECARLAGLLRQRAAKAETPELAGDALYRAAAIDLPRAETREAGIAGLGQALERNPDVDRAMSLVTAAGLPPAELVKLLPLYERVARASGDDDMLFDYLARRAETPSVTPAELREAIDLALALGRSERVEALLLRLADVAGAQPDGGKSEVAWALLELVHRRKAAGDLEGAAQQLQRAADVLDPERVLSLARELGERAARAGNLRLGTQLLEQLRTRNPADESLWRPLLAHYIEMADRQGVDRVVGETLPLLVEPAKRNEVRVTRARFLLAHDDRDTAAAEPLRDVLLEDPRHAEALRLLASYYERTGAESDLIDLLEQAFEQRAESGDHDGAAEAALRLGQVLERGDQPRAAALYERALKVAPGRRDLIRRLLALTPVEEITAAKAVLLEGLLAEDAAHEAADLARTLAEVWLRLDDEEAVRRVLERGCALAPADAALAEQLERWYREHGCWGPLADLLAGEAERQPESGEAAAILCEAAALRASRLGDSAGALALLRQARGRAPEDTDVLALLARALIDAGDPAGALAEVHAALEGAASERRISLLLLRAELHHRRGDRRSEVAALQEAHALSPGEGFNPLADALMDWRKDAGGAGDGEAFREATLILADILHRRGALAEARQFVQELLTRGLGDARATHLASELAEEAGDLEGALSAATRLLPLAPNEEKLAAAERLAELAERVGRPAEATAPIEAALAASPGEARLVARLAQLYEAAGDTKKLGMLLFDQAQRSSDEEERYRHLTRAGALLVEVGESSVALMALNEAHTMRPQDGDTMLLLSDVHGQTGDWRAAANLLQPLIAAHKGKASPALAALYVRLARLAAHIGDSKAELQALSRALDADKKNGAVATELADRAEALGDHELATKALRLITVHQSPGSLSVAVAFLRQAKIAHRRGETDRAVLFARRAVQEADQNDPVVAESQEFLRSVGAG